MDRAMISPAPNEPAPSSVPVGPADPKAAAGASASPGIASRLRRALADLASLASAILRASGRIQIFAQAASLSFLSLTAIVPVATVILIVMASVPAFSGLRDQLQAFLAANLLLPEVADQIMGYINDFAAAAGRLSVVGTLGFVATAFTTMLTVDHALNEIWGSPEPRPIVYRLLIYWAALTVGPIVLAAVIAMRIEDVLSTVGGSMLGAPIWLPWLMMTLLLALIFHVLPNRRVRLVHALIGGAVAALLLEALKSGLQFYITAYPTYQAVYGAFSVLPVFLFWLYVAWMAVLFGALVAANLGYPEAAAGSRILPWQEFERGRRVLELLLIASDRGRGVQAGALAGLMERNVAIARRVGQALVRLGYIARVAPGAVAVAPAFADTAPIRPAARAGGAAPDPTAVEDESGAVPASEIWAETWMATPRLAQMSLRPLYDEIWSQGRLDEKGARVDRPSRWRRRLGAGRRRAATPDVAGGMLSAGEIDRPLGELAGSRGRPVGPAANRSMAGGGEASTAPAAAGAAQATEAAQATDATQATADAAQAAPATATPAGREPSAQTLG